MKTKTVFLIVMSLAAASVVYMCWCKKKEWLDLGLGTGMLNAGIGPVPSYEGFTLDENAQPKKEGYCGACS